MTPSQARAFHAVATEGSFTAAARRLSVTQPSVTNQVKELERLYGVELFIRGSRGVTVTPAGVELLAILDRMFGAYGEATDLLLQLGGLRRGALRIGAYGPFMIMKVLADFRRLQPNVDVSLVLGNSHMLESRILASELDVGLFARTEQPGPFHVAPYREVQAVAIVPRRARWENHRAIRVAELLEHVLIRRERGSAVRIAADAMLARHGIADHPAMEVGSREGVVSAVAEGLGAALIFDEGFFPEAVIRLPFADCDLFNAVSLVCLAERRSSPLIRAFFAAAGA